jgi:hypothetical protein
MNMKAGISRVLATVFALVLGLVFAASNATASDTFSLQNQSKTAQLQGISLWGKGNTLDSGCRTGPFPGPTETEFTFNPGDKGSITLSQDPFSDCPPGINPLIDNWLAGPGFGGVWVYIPVDPFVGDSHLTCSILSQSGPNYLQTSVDGLACTMDDAGDSTSGTFGSSAAPLRKGKAVAYVQHFPTSEGRQTRARYVVILRTGKGAFLGKETVTVRAGKPQRVRLSVNKAIRAKVRKNGSARVKAIIRRADGKRGSGDRANLIVTRDSADIPF